jgi:hypothetical protein
VKPRRHQKRKKKEKTDLSVAGAIGGTLLGASIAGPPGALIGGIIGLLVSDSANIDKNKPGKTKRKKGKNMADNKIVFIAFAIEDETIRNFLVGQSLHTDTPFEWTDMSVKEAYDSGWKDKVRTRIRRSDGVIVLVSKNSLTSTGQAWEISCAKEEKKPILAIWAYKEDRTILSSVSTVLWTWPTMESFINGL